MRANGLFKSKYKYSVKLPKYKKHRFGKKILISVLVVLVLASLTGIGYLSKKSIDENKFAKYGSQSYDMLKMPMFYPNTPDDIQEDMIRKADEYYAKLIAEGKVYVPDPAEVEGIFVKDGVKTCYLTFDDGPSVITDDILDILKKHDIKATFFVIGEQMQYFKDIVRRMYKEGHTIGNHSYYHDYKAIYKDGANFENELMLVKKSIDDILGVEYERRIFRFPGGSFEQGKQEFKQILIDHNYKYVDWNSLTGDSEVIEPDFEFLFNNLVDTTKGREDIVVLMHDAGAKRATAEHLEKFINYLKMQGFTFKAI